MGGAQDFRVRRLGFGLWVQDRELACQGVESRNEATG